MSLYFRKRFFSFLHFQASARYSTECEFLLRNKVYPSLETVSRCSAEAGCSAAVSARAQKVLVGFVC
jgi:hypothetical protein